VLNLDLSIEQAQKIVALSESVRETLETSLNKISQKAAKFFSLTTNTVMSSKFVKNFQRNDDPNLFGEEMQVLNDLGREDIIPKPVDSSSPNASINFDDQYLIASDIEQDQNTDSMSNDLNEYVSSKENDETSFGAETQEIDKNDPMELNTSCSNKIDWNVPEMDGPIGCDFYEKCKGLDNYKNYTEARSKPASDHLNKNDCPYYNNFMKVIQILLRFGKINI
jgi:hypothetical protein